MSVDISDLLKIDDRLDYGWREAKVENEILHIDFPNLGEYKVLTEHSEVKDNTWYLKIEHYWGLHAAAIDNQHHRIPKGVERIVIGEVIDINKEKYTTKFIDVLKLSPPDRVYPIMVFIKPDDEEKLKKAMEVSREERLDAINNAYEHSMSSLKEYLNAHSIGIIMFWKC